MSEPFPHQAEIIQVLLSAEPSIKKIFLFGSRVEGMNKNGSSDIDLGIIAESKLSMGQLAMINIALDTVDTLYSIDVVDFTSRKDEFAEEAMSRIEVLYEKG